MASASISGNRIISYSLEKLECELQYPQYNRIKDEPWIISMDRVGKAGKRIKVYKVRTMHSGSRYLQNYLMQKNGLVNGDKIANDFRHTKYSSFLRAFFVDELPMVVNLLRGDIKLIGVRVISESKTSVLSKQLQKSRNTVKPALIPIYYCYPGVKSLQDYERIELKYIEEYSSSPILTDLTYMFRFLTMIIRGGVRRVLRNLRLGKLRPHGARENGSSN